jgi:hypothetical protein
MLNPQETNWAAGLLPAAQGKMDFRTGWSYLATGAGGIGVVLGSGTGVWAGATAFLAGVDGIGAGVTLLVVDLTTTPFSQELHSSQQQSSQRNMSTSLSIKSRTGVMRRLPQQPQSQPTPQHVLTRQGFSHVTDPQHGALQTAGPQGDWHSAGLQQPILQKKGMRQGFSHAAGAQVFTGAQALQAGAHGAQVFAGAQG